ncbi:MAG: serine/threonine protein kinase [Planctomycetaceae bacterium]|nr:serine/threonine protein kinase [Planctomycetales bacterium]MCB9927026.1 serine/threonine protein kinase [Planctomycetaceae bacterium]
MSQLPDFLGPYRLLKYIRSGNSSQIWEAVRDKSDRFILKILRSDNWGNKEEIALLKHEFEVGHALTHPSIIRIHEFNLEGPIAYLVLDVFSSLNVKQAMRESHAKILVHFSKIAEQMTLALGHMHEKGWVHCDVKPDNFLLNEKGIIKLIDFTISRKAATGMISRMFGKQKVIQGTRSYMSPEQIRGQALDGRADIYSLGCVLFELLGGKPPFFGDSPNDLLQKHLTASIPSVVVQNDNVMPELAALLRKMMSKKPEDRPGSMAEVMKELRAQKPFKLAPKLPASSVEATDNDSDKSDS